MRSITGHLRPKNLTVLLHRTVLALLLTLGPILATACSRLEALRPTVERSTAVAADQSGAESPPGPPASPSPIRPPVQTSPSPSPLVPRGTLAAVYQELRSLASASSFTIVEEGAGLATVRAGAGTMEGSEQYSLTRTQTTFSGLGVGWMRLNRLFPTAHSAERRYELPVQVPTDVAEHFLRDLTTVPIADGPNVPIRVADGFYHVEFAILSDAGRVGISVDSRRGALWTVEYGARQMVITDSAPPWGAYQLIRPYFEGFKKMGRDKLEEMDLEPAPSPSPLP